MYHNACTCRLHFQFTTTFYHIINIFFRIKFPYWQHVIPTEYHQPGPIDIKPVISLAKCLHKPVSFRLIVAHRLNPWSRVHIALSIHPRLLEHIKYGYCKDEFSPVICYIMFKLVLILHALCCYRISSKRYVLYKLWLDDKRSHPTMLYL